MIMLNKMYNIEISRQNTCIRQSSIFTFDGKDADGKDAYKAANAKENYWFGTDQLGRDLWTRTWKGAQISLFIGVVAAMLDILLALYMVRFLDSSVDVSIRLCNVYLKS